MEQSYKKSLDENAELMRKAADGDFEAYQCLYQRFATVLKQFFVIHGADRDSVDDLVQKIFTSLWKKRKNYPEASSFEAYLYSMARNTLYTEIRRSKRIASKSLKKQLKFESDIHKILSHPEAECYLEELTEAIESAKLRLTNEQYKALQVAQNPDIDFQRILEEHGWSVEAYKSHLKRARKKIREQIAPIFLEELKHKKRRNRP